jgi:hypothetical protein
MPPSLKLAGSLRSPAALPGTLATLTPVERDELLAALAGWVTKQQLMNITAAILSGRLDPAKYRRLESHYILEGADNGGFTRREQYALGFANT